MLSMNKSRKEIMLITGLKDSGLSQLIKRNKLCSLKQF